MRVVLFCGLLAVCCQSTYTEYDIDREYDSSLKLRDPPTSDGQFINSGTPGGVPVSFDCAVRQYAWEYGRQIQPRHGDNVELFDALQLAACNITRPQPHKRQIPKFKPTTATAADCTFYIDAVFGSDSNDGSSSSPFQSIQRGVDATRNSRSNQPECIINLMEGTYYQNDTVVLNAADSYLTFQNYNGERVTISGGVPLQFNGGWSLENYQQTEWTNYTNRNNVYGRCEASQSNDLVKFLGKVNSYDDCLNAALTSPMNPFYSITWHSLQFGGDFAGLCYGLKDISWQPVQENEVYSGRIEGRNIWSRKVTNTADLLDNKITGLRVDKRRAIRARYPDQNPETAMQYAPLSGWVQYGTKWNPPPNVANAADITQTASDWPGVIWPMDPPGNTTWTGEGDWGEFFQGKGGPCKNMTPDYGYWCAHDAPRGITQHESPSGIILDPVAIPNAPYSDVSDAVIHSWRPSHWYTWMWTAGDYNAQTGELKFADGGFQGGEGETKGAEWYIENVFDELDSPGEYFYNSSTNMLYYYYNTTTQTAPPQDTEFVATRTKILFNITGSQQKPVQNITFQGIEFRDTPYTYMDPHGLPSGGDWAIQPQGAITLVGTEMNHINQCLFTHLDGIGIFLRGYNRNTTIEYSTFSWIGDSAMAGWGLTTGLESTLPGGGPDGRNGDQPRGTVIRYNQVHELGIWEKQSSMWFQATSCQTRLVNNIFFNGPRAAVNVNDGFGGDNHMIGNLLLNTCRESGDHGPWNSWDRVPYITTVGNGSASIIPGWQQIHNNFIIGTYQTQEGIDTDDGSSYYKTTDNFFVYGANGLKNDFGGHDNRHIDNVYAYIQHAWTFCCISGANDIFEGNSVISSNNGCYSSNCKLPKGTAGMMIRNNSIYIPSGTLSVCGMTFQQWQAQGNDPGTTINKVPTDQEVINMGKEKLMNNYKL